MQLTCEWSFPFFTRHENHFKIAILLQAIPFVLASTMLDEGETLRFTLLAAIAYWSIVAIIMLRRNGNAGRLDRFLMAWGFPLMLPLVGLLLAVEPVGWLRR